MSNCLPYVICGFSKDYLMQQTRLNDIVVIVGCNNIDYKLYMYPKFHPYFNNNIIQLQKEFAHLYKLDTQGKWNTIIF